MGRYSYGAAIVNILLGMIYLEVKLVYFILAVLWFVILLVGYHLLDLHHRKILALKNKKKNDEKKFELQNVSN